MEDNNKTAPAQNAQAQNAPAGGGDEKDKKKDKLTRAKEKLLKAQEELALLEKELEEECN